jgi:hypothetical protein
MHVDGPEAGAIEGCRHFHLTVDALLAQDAIRGRTPLSDIGRGDVLIDIEAQAGGKARIVLVEQAVELLQAQSALSRRRCT